MISIDKTLLIKLLSHQHAKIIGYTLCSLSILWVLLNLVQTSAILFYRPPASTSTIKVQANTQQAALLGQVASWHLFGQTPPASINENNLPSSSLNLSINGIFYQTNKKLSQALITDANGKTALYKIGDIVPGGVTLYDILPDQVIIQSNNTLEKLSLPDRELPFASPPQGLPQ